MSPRPIQLSAPWFDDSERARVAEALSGRVAGDGPFTRRVERRLAELLGVSRVFLTTSCTHALELALLALGVGRGDEVICPAFTFASTANAVVRVGARPIFADIDDETLGLDPADVEARLTPRTAAILPVHYAGVAPRMDVLLEIATMKGLRTVEDAAHALGATFDGRPLGTLGDAGCFSFHETKNVTCGEGGAVVFKDVETTRRAEIIREKGTNRAAFFRGEVDKYSWVAEGSSYVLSDILAAVLDAQLDKLTRIQARRATITAAYRAELSEWAHRHGVRMPLRDGRRETNDHIFNLIFPEEADRETCLRVLRERHIGAASHYVPLHTSPFGRSLGSQPQLPVTERVARRLLRLPLHPGLSPEDIDRVVNGVRESLP